VQHHRPVFGADLGNEHARIDGVLVPSLWHENSPYVVLEALANGTAVIASDQAGIRHLIEPDRTGWLVTPGDPDAWARACRRAADSPNALRRMQESARFLRTTSDFVNDLEPCEAPLLAVREHRPASGAIAVAAAG
jgi:glycosyltransferase involved in cell wall biosynthesis